MFIGKMPQLSSPSLLVGVVLLLTASSCSFVSAATSVSCSGGVLSPPMQNLDTPTEEYTFGDVNDCTIIVTNVHALMLTFTQQITNSIIEIKDFRCARANNFRCIVFEQKLVNMDRVLIQNASREYDAPGDKHLTLIWHEKEVEGVRTSYIVDRCNQTINWQKCTKSGTCPVWVRVLYFKVIVSDIALLVVKDSVHKLHVVEVGSGTIPPVAQLTGGAKNMGPMLFQNLFLDFSSDRTYRNYDISVVWMKASASENIRSITMNNTHIRGRYHQALSTQSVGVVTLSMYGSGLKHVGSVSVLNALVDCSPLKLDPASSFKYHSITAAVYISQWTNVSRVEIQNVTARSIMPTKFNKACTTLSIWIARVTKSCVDVSSISVRDSRIEFVGHDMPVTQAISAHILEVQQQMTGLQSLVLDKCSMRIDVSTTARNVPVDIHVLAILGTAEATNISGPITISHVHVQSQVRMALDVVATSVHHSVFYLGPSAVLVQQQVQQQDSTSGDQKMMISLRNVTLQVAESTDAPSSVFPLPLPNIATLSDWPNAGANMFIFLVDKGAELRGFSEIQLSSCRIVGLNLRTRSFINASLASFLSGSRIQHTTTGGGGGLLHPPFLLVNISSGDDDDVRSSIQLINSTAVRPPGTSHDGEGDVLLRVCSIEELAAANNEMEGVSFLFRNVDVMFLPGEDADQYQSTILARIFVCQPSIMNNNNNNNNNDNSRPSIVLLDNISIHATTTGLAAPPNRRADRSSYDVSLLDVTGQVTGLSVLSINTVLVNLTDIVGATVSRANIAVFAADVSLVDLFHVHDARLILSSPFFVDMGDDADYVVSNSIVYQATAASLEFGGHLSYIKNCTISNASLSIPFLRTMTMIKIRVVSFRSAIAIRYVDSFTMQDVSFSYNARSVKSVSVIGASVFFVVASRDTIAHMSGALSFVRVSMNGTQKTRFVDTSCHIFTLASLSSSTPPAGTFSMTNVSRVVFHSVSSTMRVFAPNAKKVVVTIAQFLNAPISDVGSIEFTNVSLDVKPYSFLDPSSSMILPFGGAWDVAVVKCPGEMKNIGVFSIDTVRWDMYARIGASSLIRIITFAWNGAGVEFFNFTVRNVRVHANISFQGDTAGGVVIVDLNNQIRMLSASSIFRLSNILLNVSIVFDGGGSSSNGSPPRTTQLRDVAIVGFYKGARDFRRIEIEDTRVVAHRMVAGGSLIIANVVFAGDWFCAPATSSFPALVSSGGGSSSSSSTKNGKEDLLLDVTLRNVRLDAVALHSVYGLIQLAVANVFPKTVGCNRSLASTSRVTLSNVTLGVVQMMMQNEAAANTKQERDSGLVVGNEKLMRCSVWRHTLRGQDSFGVVSLRDCGISVIEKSTQDVLSLLSLPSTATAANGLATTSISRILSNTSLLFFQNLARASGKFELVRCTVPAVGGASFIQAQVFTTAASSSSSSAVTPTSFARGPMIASFLFRESSFSSQKPNNDGGGEKRVVGGSAAAGLILSNIGDSRRVSRELSSEIDMQQTSWIFECGFFDYPQLVQNFSTMVENAAGPGNVSQDCTTPTPSRSPTQNSASRSRPTDPSQGTTSLTNPSGGSGSRNLTSEQTLSDLHISHTTNDANSPSTSVSKASAASETRTVSLPVPPPPPFTTALNSDAASGMIIASLFSANPLVGSGAARQRKVMQMSQGCGDSTSGRRAAPDAAASPLGMSIGDVGEDLAPYRGQLVGNVIFIFIVLSGMYFVGVVFAELVDREADKGLRLCRFPSVAIVIVFVLVPDTASAAATVLTFSEIKLLDLGCAVAAILVYIILPIVVYAWVLKKMEELKVRFFERKIDVDDGQDEQDEEEDEEEDDRRRRSKNKSKKTADKKSKRSRSRGSAAAVTIPTSTTINKKDDKKDEEKKKKKGIFMAFISYLLDNRHGEQWEDTMWVQRWGLLFEPSRSPRFMLFELLLVVVIGLLEGTTLGDAPRHRCLTVTSISVALFVFYIGALWKVSPYLARLDAFLAWSNGLLSLIISTLSLLMHAGAGERTDLENGLEVLSVCALVVGFIGLLTLKDVVQVFNDLLAYLREKHCGNNNKNKNNIHHHLHHDHPHLTELLQHDDETELQETFYSPREHSRPDDDARSPTQKGSGGGRGTRKRTASPKKRDVSSSPVSSRTQRSR